MAATLSSTTLAAAVTLPSATTLKVASATGIVAGHGLFVDKEYMIVTSVSGTTIGVVRGAGGTTAGTHASGETVYHGPQDYFTTEDRAGSGTDASELVLPRINILNGKIWDLVSSAWVDTVGEPERHQITLTSATPGTVRVITGAITLPAAVTSGNPVGVRGEVTIPSSGTVAGAFLYGCQGKVITGTGTVSGTAVAGVYGQLDVTGGTLSGGNNAAVQANIFGANTGTWANLQGLYVEHAGGGVINSLIRLFGKSTYVFDIETNVHDNASGTGSVTTNAGYIKVNIDGATRYIGLGSAVS